MKRTTSCTTFFRPRLECLEGRDVPSTTTLTVAPNPGTAGQVVTLTATITMTDGDAIQPGTGWKGPGRVIFYDGGTALAMVTVTPSLSGSQGTAVMTTSGLTVGSHALSATYSGEIVGPIPYRPGTGGSSSGVVNEVVNLPLARMAFDAFLTAGGLVTGNAGFWYYGVSDYLSVLKSVPSSAQQSVSQAYFTDLFLDMMLMSSQA
jgi:hypothetical protein